MIDHTAVNVSDQEAAKAFYSKALEPLGYSLAFEAGDDRIQQTHLLGVLSLGILDPVQSRPHNGLQISQHGVMVDPRERLRPTLGDIANGVFDEASRVGLQVLRNRVFEIENNEVASAAPGMVHKPGRHHRHGESRAAH